MLADPEHSGVEFKRDDIRPEDLAKELVAFTNLEGGIVLLGVEDDGSVSGLVRQNAEEWVMETCRTHMRPPIIPWFQIVRDIQPGKHVAIVQVSRGYSVHSRWHREHHTYFIRVGSTSREASQEELARLFQQRGQMRAELQSISGTSMSDLDRSRLRDYFGRVRMQPVPESDEEWLRLLVNTELLTDDGDAVTMAALLLFGRTPARWLPQSGVDAVAYPGIEEDYDATERLTIRGPMTARWSADGEIIEAGVVEEALSFVRRNVAGTTVLVGGVRQSRPGLPEEPVREAVVNALTHRDWLLSGTTVKLSVFSDRLEIVSPGRLPNGITPERMRAGTRAARNQLIKDVLRDYGYLEHMGMGVPRKLIAGMHAFNGTDPDLVEDAERFTVRLHW